VIHGPNPDFTVHRIDLGPAFILGVGRRVAFEGFVMMWIAIGWLACAAAFLELSRRAPIIPPDEDR
jgi:hypothetical protein